MTRRKPPPPPSVKLKGTRAKLDLARAVTVQQAAFRCMLIYIDTPGLSLRELWRTRRLNDEDDTSPYVRDCLAWSTLEQIALKGHWATRRREHWKVVEERVLDTLQTSAVKREIEELQQLEGVEAVLHTHIHGVTDASGRVKVEAVKPKSLEGAVGALVNLGKYRDKKRERVQEEIASKAVMRQDDAVAPTGGITPDIDDALDEDDIETMAIALARKRAGLKAIEGASDDGEE